MFPRRVDKMNYGEKVDWGKIIGEKQKGKKDIAD
jgi:hypothetical protein